MGEARDRLEREELAEAAGTGADGEGEKMGEQFLEAKVHMVPIGILSVIRHPRAAAKKFP